MGYKAITKPVKGYKVFVLTDSFRNQFNSKRERKYLTCRTVVFGTKTTALAKMHTVVGVPILCSNGYHFCKKLNHCFNYYSGVDTDLSRHAICEVEGHGLITTNKGDKVAASKLKIIKILTEADVKAILSTERSVVKSYKTTKHKAIIQSHLGYVSRIHRTRRDYYIVIHGEEFKVPRTYAFKDNIGCEIEVEIKTTTVYSPSEINGCYTAIKPYNTYKAKFL